MMSNKIAVLGAGSWGTALAMQAARNGCPTLLWGHNPAHMETLKQDRENHRYLPNLLFSENLAITDDLADIAAFSDLILVSVPSHAFKDTLMKLKPLVSSNVKIAWATKGFNKENGGLLHEIVAEVFGDNTPAALISGPSFAREVAADLPTAISIASTLANEFAEAEAGLHMSSLYALGLILFVITFIVLAAAKLMLLQMGKSEGSK
jgi:glycerol-3-phosphate dehydrogenase (NAD(P)+)